MVLETGGTIRSFCRVTGQTRSRIYNWIRREKEGKLEDAKPVAREINWRVSLRKIGEVLKMVRRYPEIATDYVVGIRTGLSPSTVNKIKRGYLVKPVREEDWNIVKKSYSWLKRDVCWSMDTMMVRFMGGWLYVMLIIEEKSRMILAYKIAEKKLGIYAKDLLSETIIRMNTKPLVIKHDRGSEFENDDFLKALEEENIISLPSPGYYAQFNSMLERTNRIIRRFTAPLEIKYDRSEEHTSELQSP
jgi:transposase InsO family protein